MTASLLVETSLLVEISLLVETLLVETSVVPGRPSCMLGMRGQALRAEEEEEDLRAVEEAGIPEGEEVPGLGGGVGGEGVLGDGEEVALLGREELVLPVCAEAGLREDAEAVLQAGAGVVLHAVDAAEGAALHAAGADCSCCICRHS